MRIAWWQIALVCFMVLYAIVVLTNIEVVAMTILQGLSAIAVAILLVFQK